MGFSIATLNNQRLYCIVNITAYFIGKYNMFSGIHMMIIVFLIFYIVIYIYICLLYLYTYVHHRIACY